MKRKFSQRTVWTVILAVLLTLVTAALVITIIRLSSEKSKGNSFSSGNVIGSEEVYLPDVLPTNGDFTFLASRASAPVTLLGNTTSVYSEKITLTEEGKTVGSAFNVTDLLPGDSVEKKFVISVKDDTVESILFSAALTSGNVPGDKLTLLVKVGNTPLYVGTFGNVTEIPYTYSGLPVTYTVSVALDKTAGNEYADLDLGINFKWGCYYTPAYSVRYTDGVEGSVLFADQTYTALEGAVTPVFDGTPARSGYLFKGWSPEVAATVTCEATYTALWEELYTVTYTDGVGDSEVFTDQVYGDLKSGSATPAFVGTPSRQGYTFEGWAPAVGNTITGNVIYTAQWKVIPKYTVTYTDGVIGETVFADQSYTLEVGSATPSFIGTVSREGYVFESWSPALSDTVTASVTYTAQWSAIPEYSVTYTDGIIGETLFEDQVYQVTANSKTPAFVGMPSREGYLFNGWNPAVAETVTSDVTYTAVWVKKDTYTIRYTDGVSTSELFFVQVYSYVDAGSPTPAFQGTPAREGYTFIGWSPEVAPTVTADVTYTALWQKIPEYTVIYTDGVDGETVFEDRSYTLLANSETPAFVGTPTRDGYRFIGWSPEVSSTVTAGVTYTALWEKLYTVIYTDGVDDTILFYDQVYFGLELNSVTPAFQGTPQRIGYHFVGWSPARSALVTADVTYTAVWNEIPTYTVRYTDGVSGETVFADQTYYLTAGYPTPAFSGTPARNGYVFAGWSPAVSVNVLCDITYTAQWIKLYTVTYTDGVSDKTVFADQTISNIVSDTATPDFSGTPTRSGYLFKGWNPEVAATVTNDVTYVAQWEKLYTVAYTDGVDDETIFTDQVTSDIVSGTSTPAFSGTPSRDGYLFKGWNPEVAATVTNDVTFVAQWEKLYTVTYTDGVDGETVFTDQVTSDIVSGTATPAFSGTPSRDGYLFKGWNPTTAATVTESVIYTAVWEQLYTVTYTDGVDGEMIFTDQVTSDIVSGTATPAFDGTPSRSGYTFVGWTPMLSVTVTEDVVYTAVWQLLSTYTVTYTDGVDGETVFTDQITSDIVSGTATPAFSGTPSRDGYLFKGWNPTIASAVTENVIYTAVWEQLYTVTYTDGVDGETIFADQVTSDIVSGTATPDFDGTPARVGYLFKGWNPTVSATVTGDATYTAVWEQLYTVIYTDGVNGEAVFADQVNSDIVSGTSTPAFSGTPSRSGYLFKGWNPEVAATVTGDAVYTAVWEELYTVIYTDGVSESTVFTDQIYSSCQKDTTTPAFPGTPAREGYTFKGWNPSVSATVTANVTYTAQWEMIVTYTVTYTDGVGGVELFADQTTSGIAYGEATPAFVGTPSRDGYRFVGWTPNVTETVTEDLTYTALWEALYTVTYSDGENGTLFTPQTYINLINGSETPVFSGTPSKTGYTFVGWSPAIAATVTANVTYTAVFREIPRYTVTYTDGIDSVEVFKDQVTDDLLSGDATPAFIGTPSRDGYRFVGWTPKVAETVTKDITYTALWEELYTVIYTDGVNDAVIFDDHIHLNLVKGSTTPAFNGTPLRDGYRFVGWTPSVSARVTGNVTYTALWESIPVYTVRYTDGINGTVFADQIYTVKQGSVTPIFVGAPRRDGYTFGGFYPTVSATVTADITYTAIWNLIPTYTVRYSDGVDGERVFADRVFNDLTEGSDTPSFIGTPKRTGYTFIGWSPAISAKVTASVTYLALWRPVAIPDISVTVERNIPTSSNLPVESPLGGDSFTRIYRISPDDKNADICLSLITDSIGEDLRRALNVRIVSLDTGDVLYAGSLYDASKTIRSAYTEEAGEYNSYSVTVSLDSSYGSTFADAVCNVELRWSTQTHDCQSAFCHWLRDILGIDHCVCIWVWVVISFILINTILYFYGKYKNRKFIKTLCEADFPDDTVESQVTHGLKNIWFAFVRITDHSRNNNIGGSKNG